MTERTNRLHAMVQESFRRAFGEPHRHIGPERHWSLRPFTYVAAINVLTSEAGELPLVWIFDPHDPSDGVRSITIHHESEIAGIVSGIENRVKHAGRPQR